MARLSGTDSADSSRMFGAPEGMPVDQATTGFEAGTVNVGTVLTRGVAVDGRAIFESAETR